uniref:Ig-like domain-containing protein n=1 Tax=Amphiprion ocellaris TaxID=80972 RepID=A0A3Q1BVU0_AMPOC
MKSEMLAFDVLTPFKDVLMSLEGDSVTLSCNYSVSVNNLYWYQQKSSSSPQLLIAEYSEKTEKLAVRHDRQSKELHLNISSAAVSDSAVYYCALEPTVTGNSKTLYKNTLTSCWKPFFPVLNSTF